MISPAVDSQISTQATLLFDRLLGVLPMHAYYMSFPVPFVGVPAVYHSNFLALEPHYAIAVRSRESTFTVRCSRRRRGPFWDPDAMIVPPLGQVCWQLVIPDWAPRWFRDRITIRRPDKRFAPPLDRRISGAIFTDSHSLRRIRAVRLRALTLHLKAAKRRWP